MTIHSSTIADPMQEAMRSDSVESVMADNNTMPWFFPYPHETWWLTRDMWNVAVDAIKTGITEEHPEVAEAFCIMRTTSILVGAGDVGRKLIEEEKSGQFAYLDMPWSKRVAVITPDVFIMVHVRRPGVPSLRASVKRWLKENGIESTFSPDTNDSLVNNKKFMGTQIFMSPTGFNTEFGMMTIYKDEVIFDSILPQRYKKNARGHEITGLCNEFPSLSINKALPGLYDIVKEKRT